MALREAGLTDLTVEQLISLKNYEQGFKPLLSLAHLDKETASTFPLQIKVQGLVFPIQMRKNERWLE